MSQAHRLTLRQIDVFKGREETAGECVPIAVNAVEQGVYTTVT